jgi:uncharacterized protein YbjQ (UPF0145 family)
MPDWINFPKANNTMRGNIMKTYLCAKCNQVVKQTSAQEIDGQLFCTVCAASEKTQSVEIGKESGHQKTDIMREIGLTEKEMAVTSEDDSQHIVLTSTDTIEDRRIIEYIDVISAQEILIRSIHFDPLEAESQNELIQETTRNSVALNLSKLKKKAYLLGADAAVGVRIDMSMDHQPKGEYIATLIITVGVTGTAVRLA